MRALISVFDCEGIQDLLLSNPSEAHIATTNENPTINEKEVCDSSSSNLKVHDPSSSNQIDFPTAATNRNPMSGEKEDCGSSRLASCMVSPVSSVEMEQSDSPSSKRVKLRERMDRDPFLDCPYIWGELGGLPPHVCDTGPVLGGRCGLTGTNGSRQHSAARRFPPTPTHHGGLYFLRYETPEFFFGGRGSSPSGRNTSGDSG